MPIVGVYGWDTANLAWVKMLVNSLGHVQVDVLTAPLPADAATEVTLDLVRAELDGIEGLLAAGLPAALVAGSLDVNVANQIAGFATSARQDITNDWLSRINVKLRGGLPSILDTDALKVREQNWPTTYPLSAAQITSLQAVTVGNFPATYPLSAAQIASLQQVTEQGTPNVHLHGYDGSNWQKLPVQDATYPNLRVSLFISNLQIGSQDMDAATPTLNKYGLAVMSRLVGRRDAVNRWNDMVLPADGLPTAINTLLFSVYPYGFNGSTWDRLRSYSTGILKVGRAEVGLSTLLRTDVGTVKGSSGTLYWVTMNGGAGNARIELSNDLDGSTAAKYALQCIQDCAVHVVLDPPMEFSTGIYLKTYANATDVIFGYL